ncbi:MAG TPA: protein-L-isoaspartate(D-aspartate) O-methyltransferase [Roseiflexaceae bacterium]|jgi:protein-L-isoaspartate(D-aspartate) O-methyltransferase|nr:protein-L-isoaspartate(D-aspartate) O-methyltransferase [Roseiflexaceae bacterium]
MHEHDERTAMVRTQLEQRGISDQRVLDAMAQVPRHMFVPSEVREHAYEDRALPIHEGQTISQPFIVALMAQALDLKGDERLLEIGTGSGYAAAVLSKLVGEVYTMERWPSLAQSAERRLRELGCKNVHVIAADGSAGLPEYAPFDAITVAAASPWVPRPLREQLGDGGRLVIPVGGREDQYLLRLTRQDVQIKVEKLSGVRFVPLIGKHAWEESAGENN